MAIENNIPTIDGLQIRIRGGVIEFVCHCCDMPFAYIPRSKFVIQSKHNGNPHTNTLTPAQLRLIADMMEAE